MILTSAYKCKGNGENERKRTRKGESGNEEARELKGKEKEGANKQRHFFSTYLLSPPWMKLSQSYKTERVFHFKSLDPFQGKKIAYTIIFILMKFFPKEKYLPEMSTNLNQKCRSFLIFSRCSALHSYQAVLHG